MCTDKQDPNVTPKAFLKFLEFCYNCPIVIEPTSAFSLLYLAKFYQVQKLQDKCREVLKSSISVATALTMWDSATELGEEHIATLCLDFIIANTKGCLKAKSAVSLSEKAVQELLSQPALTASELELFLFLSSWISQQKKQNFSLLASLIRYQTQFVPTQIY